MKICWFAKYRGVQHSAVFISAVVHNDKKKSVPSSLMQIMINNYEKHYLSQRKHDIQGVTNN